MYFKLGKLNELDAKEICTWKYEGNYSIYNYPDWDRIMNENWAIAIEKNRDEEFVSIINEENILCGYLRFKNNKDNVLVGIGLKPLMCGQGFGKKIMTLLKAECEIRYGHKKLSLEVRSFNERAIKCYKNAGFKIINTYYKDTYIGYDKFIKMDFNS